MKLKDVIENIDKSKNNEIKVDIYKLTDDLRIDYEWDLESEEKINNSMKGYWITHYNVDSDYECGDILYFLKDDPICYVYEGRGYTDLYWLSYNKAEKTKDYLISVLPKSKLEISLKNINDEFNDSYSIFFVNSVTDWSKVRYRNMKVELLDKEKYELFDISTKCSIKLENGEILHDVKVSDLDILINIKEDNI